MSIYVRLARLMGWRVGCRRLHQLEAEGLGGEHAAAAAAAKASPEAASEADIAALALAVLVRLTAQSGELTLLMQSYNIISPLL